MVQWRNDITVDPNICHGKACIPCMRKGMTDIISSRQGDRKELLVSRINTF